MNIIYALCDPKTEDIRYIGKSVRGTSRCDEHWRRRKEEKHSHFRIYRWLNKIGEKPIVRILETCETKEELALREQIWIALYKPSGILTNMTEGGDGSIGKFHSIETRRKISIKAKGRVSPTKGKPLSQKHKDILKEHRLAFIATEKGKEILSEAQKTRMARPEEYEKICSKLESYRKRKPITCSNGVTYPSIREAGRQLNIAFPNIVAVLKGRYKQISGLTFNYLENKT